jgi:hypothetical protein
MIKIIFESLKKHQNIGFNRIKKLYRLSFMVNDVDQLLVHCSKKLVDVFQKGRLVYLVFDSNQRCRKQITCGWANSHIVYLCFCLFYSLVKSGWAYVHPSHPTHPLPRAVRRSENPGVPVVIRWA